MKKTSFLLLALLLLGAIALPGCGQNESAVALDYGSYIGMGESDAVATRSHVKQIKKSDLKSLITNESSFILLLHGSADTCTCYVDWHKDVLVPYVKRHKLLIYFIELEEFESDSEYYGVNRIKGSETLAVFREGKVAYQHSTDDESKPYVNSASGFAEWMDKRIQDPRFYYVDEDVLDSYYEGDQPFTVFFGRDTCGDCTYMKRYDILPYLRAHSVQERTFFIIDFDVYRSDMEVYAAKKAKYGLSVSEDNPAGYSSGFFPTLYHISPDGVHYKGDVIEAAGVFYNEVLTEENPTISGAYFTQERYDEASSSYLTYLKDSKVEHKVLEGMSLTWNSNRRDSIQPYLNPIIECLLDYSIGPGK